MKVVQSDALSRWPDFIPEEDMDNEDVTMLLDALFINLIDTELQEQILSYERFDSNAMEALKTLLEEGPTTIQNQLSDWTTERIDGKQVLYYQGKNYIPQNEELRRDIAKMFYDHRTASHPRELETYNSVRQHYWWPRLRTYIKNYVQGCGTCQQFKIDRRPAKPAFVPTSVCKSGPVRSFGPKMQDRDRDRFTFVLEPKKTGLYRSFVVLDRSWS